MESDLLTAFLEWSHSGAFRDWISRRRWFPLGWTADIEVVDCLTLDASPHEAQVILFVKSGDEEFQLPLVLTAQRPSAGEYEPFDAMGGQAFFQEGEQAESYCSVLLRLMASDFKMETVGGRPLTFRGPPLTIVSAPRLLAAGKTTNVSVVIEDAERLVLLKSLRKLERASREPVLLEFLTDQGYPGAPTLLGSVASRDETYLAVLLSFQPSDGDLGGLVMERLAEMESRGGSLTQWAILRKLGESLAGLHRALGASDLPRFVPQTLTRRQLENQIGRGLGYYAASKRILSRSGPPTDELGELLEMREGAIRAGLENLRRAEGWPSIHIHDDLHLEQVLLSKEEPFFVDFEGEPIRPAGEKWVRNSPLRDLATLLRSLSYIKHAALRQSLGRKARRVELRLAAGDASEETLRRLNSWEDLQREALVDAYLGALRRKAPSLLPREENEVPTLIQAWELEKALYELNYEALYRPDYALIPLCALPR